MKLLCLALVLSKILIALSHLAYDEDGNESSEVHLQELLRKAFSSRKCEPFSVTIATVLYYHSNFLAVTASLVRCSKSVLGQQFLASQ